MRTRQAGSTGLSLSTLALGTLTWGRDTDLGDAEDLLATFLDAGGRTIDVPSDYLSPESGGRCAFVGDLISRCGIADELQVILHSGYLPQPVAARPLQAPSPDPKLLSRKHLLSSLHFSLDALGFDHVDLWVVHGHRRGASTPEVADALGSAYTTERAWYLGVGDFDDWDTGSLAATLASDGCRLAALSGSFSLLDAKATTTQLPHALEHGLGYVALAPLAQGVLTGKYRHSTPPDSRGSTAHWGPLVQQFLGAEEGRVVDAICRAADSLDSTPAAIALAWALEYPGITTSVVGPRTVRQLEQLLDGLVLHLPKELAQVLSEIALT